MIGLRLITIWPNGKQRWSTPACLLDCFDIFDKNDYICLISKLFYFLDVLGKLRYTFSVCCCHQCRVSLTFLDEKAVILTF